MPADNARYLRAAAQRRAEQTRRRAVARAAPPRRRRRARHSRGPRPRSRRLPVLALHPTRPAPRYRAPSAPPSAHHRAGRPTRAAARQRRLAAATPARRHRAHPPPRKRQPADPRHALARALGERRTADIRGHRPPGSDTPNGKPAKLVGPRRPRPSPPPSPTPSTTRTSSSTAMINAGAQDNVRQVGQGSVDQLGVELFDDGVVAVVGLGLQGGERAVGEHGVVAPGRAELGLPGRDLRGQPADPTHDQLRGDRLLTPGRERGVVDRGDLGVGDPALLVVVPDRLRVADTHPGVIGDLPDRAADLGVHPGGDREPGPAAAARGDGGGVVERRVHPHHEQPGGAGGPGGADRSATNEAAPRAEAAVPPRSRVPATSGALVGVEIAAISGFSPRSRTEYPPTLAWPNPAPCLACPYTRR